MILDIGANTGQWARQFPTEVVFCVEANPLCEPALAASGRPYLIVVLGENDWDVVTFYLDPDNLVSTGASYYRELTEHYKEPLISYRVTRKLDSLFDNMTFNTIKIDTQGSELDILKGGVNLISRARELIVEVSQIPYNEGAPLQEEVIQWLNEHGWFVFSKTLENHVPEKNIHQWNIRFHKKD